jgi:uncharacterized membrane protein
METRPKIKLTLTPIDKLFDTLCWLSLIILWGLTLWSYSKLPETIPVHFNGSGQVDSYGGKMTIFMLPIIGSLLFIFLTILNAFPHKFNYPRTITVDNAVKQYTNATRFMRYLKFVILIIFTLIAFKIYTVAMGEANGLGVWFLPLTFALIFIPVLYFIFKSFKTT